MSELQKITKEQIRKAEAYDALEMDLVDVKHPGEPVRECVLRLIHDRLYLASLEAHRAWMEERNARVGTDCIGTVPAHYVEEAKP